MASIGKICQITHHLLDAYRTYVVAEAGFREGVQRDAERLPDRHPLVALKLFRVRADTAWPPGSQKYKADHVAARARKNFRVDSQQTLQTHPESQLLAHFALRGFFGVFPITDEAPRQVPVTLREAA